MRSFIIVDFGITTTRAVLLDMVEGEYRLIAGTQTRSTVAPPQSNALYGLIRCLEQLQEQTGRKLWGEAGLLTPTQADGSGFDELLATASSAGRPLRAVVVAVMDHVSLASAKRALQGTYVEIMNTLTLTAEQTEEDRINALLRDRPDLIFIAGGTNAGEEESVQTLIRLVDSAVRLVPPAARPIILYAGNERLKNYVQSRFSEHNLVFTAENIRPDTEQEALYAAKLKLGQVFDNFLKRQPGGFREVSAESPLGIIPSAQAASYLIRYLDALNSGQAGTAYIDIGSGTSAMLSSFNDELLSSIRSNLGLGLHITEVLGALDWRDVERWLPFPFSLEALEEWVYNKALAPSTVPQTLRDLFIEMAIAREIVRLLRRDLGPAWSERKGSGLQFSPLIINGAIFTNIPPRLAALLVLDALEPSGITELFLDPYSLASALGVVSYREPEAVLQVVDNRGFAYLGLAFAPQGSLRRVGLPSRMEVEITLPTGQVLAKELKPGDLWIPELSPGQKVEVSIRLSRGLSLGGGRRWQQTVQTGAAGLIFDLRGRPLYLPGGRRQREKIAAWFMHASGLAIEDSSFGPEGPEDGANFMGADMNLAGPVELADGDFPAFKSLSSLPNLDPRFEALLSRDGAGTDDELADLEFPDLDEDIAPARAPKADDFDDLRKGLGL
jgi:hypothetical protein